MEVIMALPLARRTSSILPLVALVASCAQVAPQSEKAAEVGAEDSASILQSLPFETRSLRTTGGVEIQMRSKMVDGSVALAFGVDKAVTAVESPIRTIESEMSLKVAAAPSDVFRIVADVDNKDGFFTYGRARTLIPDVLGVLPKNQILTITLVDEAAVKPGARGGPALSPPASAVAAMQSAEPGLKVAISKFEFRPPNTIIETLVTDPLGDCLTCDKKKGRVVYTFDPDGDGTRFTGRASFELQGASWSQERIENGWIEFGNRLEALAALRPQGGTR
jgi:hypothetical protein